MRFLKILNQDSQLISKEVTIELSTYCGAKCVMCPRESYDFRWKNMDTNFFKNIFDQSVKLGATSLDACGFGDLFTDKEWDKKLAYIKTKYPHIKIYTSTTGQLLNSKRLQKICQYLDTIKISHYRMTKDVYEKIHQGNLKFEKIMDNLESLLSISRENRPYIIASYIIFPENEHQIQIWREFWEGREDEIMIWKPHNYGGGRHYQTSKIGEYIQPKTCGRPFKGNPIIR